MTEGASAQELADLVGLKTARSVRDLAERGVIERLPGGRYDLNTAVAAYCSHLRDVAAMRGGSSLSQERERAARERADQLALKNAQTRRELVPAAEVAAAWSDILREVRQGVLAITGRVRARLPHLNEPDLAALDAEIRAALTEIANDV